MDKKLNNLLAEIEKTEEHIIMTFDKLQDEIVKMTEEHKKFMQGLRENIAGVCEHCDGTGKVTVGEFDNIEERNCTLCNRKESVEDMMDDNS